MSYSRGNASGRRSGKRSAEDMTGSEPSSKKEMLSPTAFGDYDNIEIETAPADASEKGTNYYTNTKKLKELLRKEKRPLTKDFIVSKLRVLPEELDELKKNDYFEFKEDDTVVIKQQYTAANKTDLYSIIKSKVDGLYKSAVENCYPAVEEDIEALKKEGLIFAVEARQMKDTYLIPIDVDYRLSIPENILSQTKIKVEKQSMVVKKLKESKRNSHISTREEAEKRDAPTARAAHKKGGRAMKK